MKRVCKIVLKHQLGLEKEAIRIILNVNIFPALIIDLFSCSQVAFNRCNRCNTFQMIINNLRAVKHKTLAESPTHLPSSLTLWFYDVFITIFNIRLYKKALPMLLLLLFSPSTTTPPFATRKKADGYNPVINYEINVKNSSFFLISLLLLLPHHDGANNEIFQPFHSLSFFDFSSTF